MKHNTHNRPFIMNWFNSWVLLVSDHAHAIHFKGLTTTTRLYSNDTKHEPTDTMPPVSKYCLACLNINYIAQRLIYTSSLECEVSPEREKGEELCPLVPPFSLLLRDEDELGFDVDALLENWRDLQSAKARREAKLSYAACDGTSA